jgi:hypothetical protein
MGRPIKVRGDSPVMHDILTGSDKDGRAFPPNLDLTCANWTSIGPGVAMLGHADREGNPPVAGSQNVSAYMEASHSWNAAHTSRGCSQPDLIATGGNGLFYCFRLTISGSYRFFWLTSKLRRGDSSEAALHRCRAALWATGNIAMATERKRAERRPSSSGRPASLSPQALCRRAPRSLKSAFMPTFSPQLQRIPVKLTHSQHVESSCGTLHEKVSE